MSCSWALLADPFGFKVLAAVLLGADQVSDGLWQLGRAGSWRRGAGGLESCFASEKILPCF